MVRNIKQKQPYGAPTLLERAAKKCNLSFYSVCAGCRQSRHAMHSCANAERWGDSRLKSTHTAARFV